VNPIAVRLTRAGATESVHEVHAVITGHGHEAVRGDPGLHAFWRSSMKPFQAIPFVRDGAYAALRLGPPELALACASHHGTPRHVEHVSRILAAAAVDESGLACGPHRPLDEEAARDLDRQGILPGRIHNNCSGKHSAMLAVAASRGWPLGGYHEIDHPLQAEVRATLEGWLDEDPEALEWGVDGCGVPTPRLSLASMAAAYARLGSSRDPSVGAIVAAMTENPTLVSGPGALSAALMRATDGRLLVKEGAEGVLCLCEPGRAWGAAIKVRDGAFRAVGPAVIDLLGSAGLIGDDERRSLAAFARPAVPNTRGETVGELSVQAEEG